MDSRFQSADLRPAGRTGTAGHYFRALPARGKITVGTGIGVPGKGKSQYHAESSHRAGA